MNLTVGMPKNVRENSDNVVQSKLNEYCRDEIVKYIIEKHDMDTSTQNSTKPYDLNMKIQDAMTKLKTPIGEFIKTWTLNTLKRRHALYDAKLSEKENTSNTFKLEKDAYKKGVFAVIKKTLDKNDAMILICVIKSLLLYSTCVDKYNKAKQMAIDEYMTQLKEVHSIMSRVPSYVNDRVKTFIADYDSDHPFEDLFKKAIKDLSGQEKTIFNKYDAILNSQEYMNYKRSLEEKMIPRTTYGWEFNIWLPQHWIIHERKDHTFEVQKTINIKTSTKYPFWRIYNFLVRTCNYFCNGTRLAFLNMTHGPLGIRSLFGLEKFATDYTIDEKTGKLIVSNTTHTLISRIEALWQNIADSRAEFEAAGDTGILGKSITRVFNVIWNYGIKGILGTALCAIGHPLLTICNTVLSLTTLATSPIWAPVLSLLKYLFDIFIYTKVFRSTVSMD